LLEYRHHRNNGRSKSQPADVKAVNTMSLCKSALIILLPSMLAAGVVSKWINSMILLAIMLLVNGFILYIPRLFASGDKDSLSMSPLDSLFVGAGGVLGLLPGISRLGAMASVARLRGVKKEYCVDFLLLLMVLPLLFWALFCALGAFFYSASMDTGMIIGDILAFGASFGGACAGVWILRKVIEYKDFSTFAFYSWGAAIVAFVLYLIY
jgi:undecaprenyl pyrophosphate phosphatase UppP